MMKKRLMLLAFLLCGYLPIYSQVSLSGIVNDENGNALTGANVILVETSVGTVTDAKGEFTFSNLHSGKHQLNVSFIGYETVLQDVVLQNSIKISVSLKLKPFLTDEVIITSIRAAENTPVTKSNFSKDEIRNQSTGQDVPYLLGLTPSVVTSSDAGTGIGYSAMRIRGTDMSGINVTVNGIPFNDAESHGVYWVDMPDISTSADNIQIQRGVGSSTQGAGAFGGTINFQTSTLKTKPYADINTSYGSFNTLKNSISFGTGLLNDHFIIDGRLSRISSDGYVDRGWSNLKSYYLAGAWYNKNSLLKFITFSGLEHTYQAWSGVPSDSLKTNRKFNSLGMYYVNDTVHYYPNQTDNYQQDNYQLLLSHKFSQSLTMNAALHFTKGKGYYEEYKSGENLEGYGLNNIITPKEDTITMTDLVRRKWLDNAFYGGTWSLNYSDNSLNASFGGGLNQYFGKHYGTVIWAQYMSNGMLDHQYYYNSGTKNDFNVFGKVSYKLNDEFSVYVDMQYRVITHNLKGLDDDNNVSITQKHTYNFFNPKFGLSYNIDPSQNLYCYFGIANREPTRDNFVNSDNNNPIRRENLKDMEIGYNFKSDNIKFGINGYYMSYIDQLIQTGKINDVGAPIFTNVPKSYRAGLEVTFQAKISRQLTWDMNFTASQNIIKSFVSFTDNWDTWPLQDTTIYKNNQIAFSPSFMGSSQIRYEIIPQLAISLQSKYVGKQYIDNTQDESRKLNYYVLNDLQLNYHLKTKYFSSIDFIVKLNNVFDEKYISNAWIYPYYEENKLKVMDGYFPQAGRNIMTSITLSF